MSYVKRHLLSGEEIIAEARIHKVVFLRALIWFTLFCVCFGARMAVTEPVLVWGFFALATLFLLFAAVAFGKAFIDYITSEYAVTNRRVLVKEGLIRRHSLELLLSKVEGILVDQGVTGRLLGYGDIVITGTGGSQNRYDHIGSPLRFRAEVQEQIATVQDKP